MNISVHLITSIIFSMGLYPLIGWYSLWAIVGGYLIDFDHYLWTVGKLKSLSLKKSYNYHFDRHKKKDYEKDLLHIFHTWEFFAFMIVSAAIFYNLKFEFLYYMFLITFLGMLLHVSLDFTSLIQKRHLDARAISLISWIKRNKKSKHP